MEKKRNNDITGAMGDDIKTIVYLHGFGSSGQSSTVKHLRKSLPQFKVLAPDIPIGPAEALPFLKDFCEKNHPDLIIGTSMGAMYAMQLMDYPRLCVNPALRMSELTDILKPGTFKYFQPTQAGETHFTITEDIIQQFREMEAHLFDGVDEENRQHCWGFFGDEDNIVNCREEFESHFAPNVQIFHGGHRMNNRTLDQIVLPFVENLLDCRNSKYKKGDWVKFISDQPSVYLSRYADGDCKIEHEEHIGIIKNVHTIMKGWYSYAIETIPVLWLCHIDEGEIICKLSDEQIKAIKEKYDNVLSPVGDLSSKYDEIKNYEGGRLDYYLAKKNGKYGILDSRGNEITPVIMDEVHEMIDTDGCIPLVKDGKWGLVHFYDYVAPIYDKMEIRSEEYVKVWLNGVQGWLDNKGQFTTEESQAYIGSWYDFEK